MPGDYEVLAADYVANQPASITHADRSGFEKARITKTHIYFANTGTIPVLLYESNHPYQKEDQARFFATTILAYFFSR
ncbi:hypothetical protein DTO027B5_3304 [Paecilomyces variotii]|nr:hypothetical protein DTO195F2_3462 [Paecilomyces variotii]KAJ9324869.1 hypothetical protein DTO027B3_4001 [Paecilomyces variotii]KAJ9334798.1 hypothetical protein DTO027B5_3304 [Paecilomyces variotii]KAJ9375193.1 hypothetical protein DTO282E5_177 [Paecilomyces variotii]